MKVTEMFESIQSEGIQIGRPAVFIRFAGCNLHCSWCDTKYSWNDEGLKSVNADYITDQVKFTLANLVVLTGGEPFVQSATELSVLCAKLKELGKEIAFETNGTIIPSKAILMNTDLITVSPKLRSASPAIPFTVDDMRKWLALGCEYNIQIKFVVQDGKDMDDINELTKDFTGIELSQVAWVIQPEESRAQEIYRNLYKMTLMGAPKIADCALFIPQTHKMMNVR